MLEIESTTVGRTPLWQSKDSVADSREQSFQRYLASKVEYVAKIEANGNTPWFKDPEKLTKLGISGGTEEDRRRGLFMRRYTRPAPPQSIPALTLDRIRGEAA
jgi:hypothetical protein